MRRAAALLALLVAVPAAAEVTASAPAAFTSRHAASIAAPPAQVWAALLAWHRWWPAAHSYSGTAPTLDARAGGALAESWSGGTVRHATVVAAMPPRLLRLHGGFGPLQALPVAAVLEFELKPEGQGTALVLTYRVAGPGLDGLAAPVDGVMAEGFARLTRFAVAGTP